MEEDARFSRPLMTLADAGRHLGIPRQTFHRWAKGYERGGPLLHVPNPDSPRRVSVPFVALAEAWVLEGLRQAGVRPQRIRPALTRLQQEFGHEYVLVSAELATDGISVLWDFSRTEEGAGLIEGGTGQVVMREIVQDYLQYLGFGADNYPNLLVLKQFEPTKVVIDPYRSSGQPVFDGAGAKVANVAAMLKAGEDPAIVAEEHGVGIDEVRAAARASSWAAPPEFYLDENAVTRTVRKLLVGLGYRCHTPPEVFGTRAESLGADDVEWLGKVARSGWVVLNRDAKIMERPHELAAYRAARVHMFYLPGEATRDRLMELSWPGAQVRPQAFVVAVDDVGATGELGAGLALVAAVALEAVGDESDDDDQCGDGVHGIKFALDQFLPKVADPALCDKILPRMLGACSGPSRPC